MIHYGDYYRIVDKEKVLSLLEEIDQNIIWMIHQKFIWNIILLSRSLGQDPDTPTYKEVLSGSEDLPCDDFQWATKEDLFAREKVTSRTERPSVREPVTNANHAPNGQA